MIKTIKSKVVVLAIGAMMLGGSAYAMQCAPGKCGGSMKSEMKKSVDEEKGMKHKYGEKKEEMKGKCESGKCGEGMKEKMKGEMKGKCAGGKCGK
ncbi:MAG: hypothetical protein L3J42_03840 [Hydrogenimonas sp.]|nr:hypothetical protein [Hydrogenimonas sp.]